MAEPIEFGLVIEGEDAKIFFEKRRKSCSIEEMIEMFKKAKNIRK